MKTKLKKTGRMKTSFFITISCIGCLCLLSCGKTHCPAFPEHLLDYSPYSIGDTLIFVNQHNDSLIFCVHEFFITQKSSFGLGCGCDCENPSAELQAHTLPIGSSLKWHISAGDNHSKPFIRFILTVYPWDDGTFDKWNFLVYFNETGKNPFDSQNSSLFGDTVIIKDDTQLINRVTAVKGEGIIGFSDQVNHFQWKSIKK